MADGSSDRPDLSTKDFTSRLERRLGRIYGSDTRWVTERITEIVNQYPRADCHPVQAAPWNERDVVLITYADQIRSSGRTPLATLREFLLEDGWDDVIRTVHLLPFFPYSSDDGFSVIDYLEVDRQVGTWTDVANLADHFDLMFDLVINHISQQSHWFQAYLCGEVPFSHFFIEADPSLDLSAVIRPRSLPLLSLFQTGRGQRYLWTSFSADQIDLNYAEPEVLIRMLEILLEYVRRGARIVRMDAVAFLWKEVGTTCLHLPQTHEVVKLFRDVLTFVAPHVLLLTETNVPHAENVSYFGDDDEAQMVYQFSLPPLLLDAFVNEDAGPIARWLTDLQTPRPGTTYFNFTASHDGIGVRPLEGLVTPDRLERLCNHVRRVGGRISTRRQADGTDVPYELNVTYVDALAPPEADEELHARRFLATQAVMLALQGMPAVYFHSLVGTQNDLEGVEECGQPRRINRHKYDLDELRDRLRAPGSYSLADRIYTGYRHLLATRIRQTAFHPDAPQRVMDTGNPALLAFQRTSLDGQQRILVAVNTSTAPQSLELPAVALEVQRELISGEKMEARQCVHLEPGQAVWLT